MLSLCFCVRVLNVPRLFMINSFQFLPQLPFTCRECLLNLLVCLLLCVTLSRTLVHNDNAAVCLVFLRFHCLVQTGCLGRLQAGHRHALMSYLSPTSLIPSWLTCPARTNLCIYLSTFSSFMVQRENILLMRDCIYSLQHLCRVQIKLWIKGRLIMSQPAVATWQTWWHRLWSAIPSLSLKLIQGPAPSLLSVWALLCY